MIHAGKVGDIDWSIPRWLILDIGFSNRKESCGILLGGDEAKNVGFGAAVNEVIETAKTVPLLNLVIEAPLSVAFDQSGNPKIRDIDWGINKEGKRVVRPWYVGAGCVVMVATMYLMKRLHDSHPSAEVRLFEGFVSFKSEENRTDHKRDVELLREAIKGEARDSRFYEPDKLEEDGVDVISAFKLMNMDLGVPPVIKVDA